MSDAKVDLADWLPIVVDDFQSGRIGGAHARQQARFLLETYGPDASEFIIHMLLDQISIMGRKLDALNHLGAILSPKLS